MEVLSDGFTELLDGKRQRKTLTREGTTDGPQRLSKAGRNNKRKEARQTEAEAHRD